MVKRRLNKAGMMLKMPEKNHIVALLVSNEPGVLARISSMFMKRHFNIDTLTVSSTTNPDVSRITLSFHGDEGTLEQVTKQLANFIDVRKVFALDVKDSMVSDLCLLKVSTGSEKDKNKILDHCKKYHASIVHENSGSVMVQVVEEPSRLDSFLKGLKGMKILEIARTGLTALSTKTEHTDQ